MLDTEHVKPESQTEHMKRRFAEAFPKGKGPTDTAIAAGCGVTKQAVSGWRRTGMIDKAHLPALARISGRSLNWWHGLPDTGDQPVSELALSVARAWESLPIGERDELMTYIFMRARLQRAVVEGDADPIRAGFKTRDE